MSEYRCFCGYSHQDLKVLFGRRLYHPTDGHLLVCPECKYMSYHIGMAHSVCLQCGFEHEGGASPLPEEDVIVVEDSPVAITADGSYYCLACAKTVYGSIAIEDTIEKEPGYKRHKDHSGNLFEVVMADSQEAKIAACRRCENYIIEDSNQRNYERDTIEL
jgi:hypothetical protein